MRRGLQSVLIMDEAAGRPVSIEEIRNFLKRSAEPLQDREEGDCWGRLNLDAAIREIRGLQEPEPVVWALPESSPPRLRREFGRRRIAYEF